MSLLLGTSVRSASVPSLSVLDPLSNTKPTVAINATSVAMAISGQRSPPLRREVGITVEWRPAESTAALRIAKCELAGATSANSAARSASDAKRSCFCFARQQAMIASSFFGADGTSVLSRGGSL